MKLAEISIARPVFAAMVIAAMMVFGLLAYPRMGVDLFPEAEFPVVTVSVVYPGADPETMESEVAEPIEEAVQSLSGIKTLSSQNLESVTQVILQFELEVSVDAALQDVRDRVSAIQRDLPEGAEPPLVQKFDIGAAPILSVGVAGEIPARELTDVADDIVRQKIERVAGVGGADLIGGREKQIKVAVDPARMSALGVTVDDVVTALRAQNLELPAGYVQRGHTELTVKTKGEVENANQVATILLPSIPGTITRIQDVATVVEGTARARSAAFLNGTSAIGLVVRKQSGANTVATAAGVREAVAELQSVMGERGVRLSIPTDTSVFIEHSIRDLQFDLLLGAVLTVVIIFMFLHDGRATLISALALPTSVVATFAVMNVMGFTFNNLTMLALSLSIGILVDDAIVVIENIHRHMEMGKSRRRAALDATSEIGLAVLATTLSIVAVFVPVAVMKGIIGRFFFQFGITVAVAVLLSMFVSFTLTPMLASRILRLTHAADKSWPFRLIDRVMLGITRAYSATLRGALGRPLLTILVAVIALFGSGALLTRIQSEFLPQEDRAQFVVNVELPAGTSLDATQRVVRGVADDVGKSLPGVITTFTTVGDATGGQVNKGRIEVGLVSSKERTPSQHEMMSWVRSRMEDVESATVTVEELNLVGGFAGQRNSPIQFVIKGQDMDQLIAGSDALARELSAVEGFVDVDTSYRGGKPELLVEVDRNRAADLGVPVAGIARTVRWLLAGDPATTLERDGDSTDVVVEMPESMRNDLASLANLKVRSGMGSLVDLSNVATLREGMGPSVIQRQDRMRQITVYADLEDVSLGVAQEIVTAKAAEILPKEFETSFIGTVEVMQESFGYMLVALGLAVVLVYLILASQFDSFVQPVTIMLSLPLSLIGAFGALFLSGMTFNIFSMIGIIMLMGLVTKNAILLVDFANTERAKGIEVREALLNAGKIRLRPILMTTAAMIFGMLPVALAISEGGEARAPMAVVVIGGLIASTLLTLVVVPVVYMLFDRIVTSRIVGRVTRMLFPPESTDAKAEQGVEE